MSFSTKIPTILSDELAQMLGELVDLSCHPRHFASASREDKQANREFRALAQKIRQWVVCPDGRYTKPFDHLGDIMTIADFRSKVDVGFLSDDDGFGYPAKNGLVDEKTRISPEDLDIPKDATHVVWFNK